jgi:hypothetical protein
VTAVTVDVLIRRSMSLKRGFSYSLRPESEISYTRRKRPAISAETPFEAEAAGGSLYRQFCKARIST